MTGKYFGRIASASALACTLAFTINTAQAQETPVHYNVGTGNESFFTVNEFTIGGSVFELGLNFKTAFGLGPATTYNGGSSYSAQPGGQPSSTRPWWNFEIHVHRKTGNLAIADLDSLTLTIEQATTLANSSGGPIDLLDPAVRDAIDCHIIGCASGVGLNASAYSAGDPSTGGHSASTVDPAAFYQSSQSMTFGWDVAAAFGGFSRDAVGDYTFTLSASEGMDAGATSATLTVVPEPATWAMMLAGFGLAGLRLKRTRRQGTPG